MVRIKRFNVLQTAKVLALVHFIGAAILWLTLGLLTVLVDGFSAQSGSIGVPVEGFGFLLMPFLYGLLGFVVGAIGCAIYNGVAGLVGGVEFELEH